MSNQRRATTQFVRVCDLCGKAVDTYGHRDWSAMNVGHPKAPTNVPEKSLFRFFRKGAGRESGAPEGDYRSWEWDFHGECLVAALIPLVTDEARKEAVRDDY
jgi:hypothetical protein